MPVQLDTEEKRIVHRYVMQVWDEGKFDLIDELVIPDVIDHDPFPGQVAGREGWKQAARMVRDAVPDLSNTIHDMVQEGDLVAVRFTSTGHLRGPFLGRGSAGDPVLIRALELQRVSGGKMCETHRLLDIRLGQDAIPASGPGWDVVAPASAGFSLPARVGPRPQTNPGFPHTQLTQKAPREFQEEILRRARELPSVRFGASFAESSTDAFLLGDSAAKGPADRAFLHGSEFAHLHRQPGDGALHMTLPAAVGDQARREGWGEPHPLAGRQVPDPHPAAAGRLLTVPATAVMIYGPRDPAETEVVWRLVQVAYAYATGTWTEPAESKSGD